LQKARADQYERQLNHRPFDPGRRLAANWT